MLLLLFLPVVAYAQVYRWVDAKGTVHYSNSPPPQGVKAAKLDIDAQPGPAATQSAECYTVRCQGERMEERIARRDAADARLAAERAAAAPPQPRGLEFRKYIWIQRGMTEGELLSVAGAPDLHSPGWDFRTYTYMPTVSDPFVTTVTLVNGRVSEVERVRRF
ncbi:MAG TPA: DUF4124 domain-containing protein [Burkholderiales bacterium]|nr:DUF4124 domain-containing protein [Burkholderiales bacterium]